MDHHGALALEDTIDTLSAMRKQEKCGYETDNWLRRLNRKRNYSSLSVNARPTSAVDGNDLSLSADEDCRNKMTVWCYTLVDGCNFQVETVEVALSLLDRFVCKSRTAQEDRVTFQLASMACLYTCVKVHEEMAMNPTTVAMLSNGVFSPEDIEGMERDVLSSVCWRVHPPTMTSFCRLLVDLIPKELAGDELRDMFLKLCEVQVIAVTYDTSLIAVTRSALSCAAVLNAITCFGFLREPVVREMEYIFLEACDADVKVVREMQHRLSDYIDLSTLCDEKIVGRISVASSLESSTMLKTDALHGSPRTVSSAGNVI